MNKSMNESVGSAEQRCDRTRRSLEGERGVAAVEFALILPLLLMLALGTTTLCHAFLMRFLMHSAAYDAARTCALAKTPNSLCVASIVNNKLQNVMKACKSGIQQPAPSSPLQPLAGVNSLEVELKCEFVGGIGRKFLEKHGLKIATITARAAMPY
jgi:Flp pilus assembly pilin Flp